VPELIQSWDLGAGESSVLTWAYANPGTEVIIDDLAARRCAAVLGIPVQGTLGLVLTAKQRGKIPAARPVLAQLCLLWWLTQESEQFTVQYLCVEG